jgi:type IV pilus assembly protein PilQ
MLYAQKNNCFFKGIILCMTVSLFVPLGAYATSMVTQNETVEAAEPTIGTRSKFITDISMSEVNDSISIAITCNTLLNYMSVKQPLPLGLVLYFPETSLEVDNTKYDIDNAIIDTIKASELIEKVRSKITILLKKDLPYQISREGNVVKVVFVRGAETETTESMQSEQPIENNLISYRP